MVAETFLRRLCRSLSGSGAFGDPARQGASPSEFAVDTSLQGLCSFSCEYDVSCFSWHRTAAWITFNMSSMNQIIVALDVDNT
jgi:hypothetical protein